VIFYEITGFQRGGFLPIISIYLYLDVKLRPFASGINILAKIIITGESNSDYFIGGQIGD
jgi:hypothetical protein